MIKKLRRKFIVINMLLVLLVLLCVFVTVILSTSQSLQYDINRSLSQSAQLKNKSPKDIPLAGATPPNNGDNFRKDPNFISVYVFSTDESGYDVNSIQTNDLIDDSELTDVAALIIQKENEQVGLLDGYNFYYYRHYLGNGYSIVSLCDANYYSSSMASMLISSLAIGTLTLIAFFIISLFLSRWALKPVEEAWIQQKQFIADASHELKTPLTVILANTKILSKNRNDKIGDQIKWIESTDEEAQNMKNLVESLLFLARSDTQSDSEIVLENEINLSELTENAELQFEPLAYERGIELSSMIDDNVVVKGDLQQMRQLLQVLLDNACKYTPHNGKILITLKKGKLSVFNSGAPIPKEDLPHLFERFYRSDKARSDSSSFGLGLSIAKRIAMNHGGDLAVESSDELDGTRFIFTFS